MALQLADRVQQLGSANTTVSFNLTSTPAGFQAFSPAITTGNTLYYTAYDGTNWEVGVGTLTSSSLLTRTTILSSSNAGAAVSTFGATVTVWLDYPAEKSVVVNDLGDVLVNQSYDNGTGVLQVTGASSFNGAVVDKSLNLQGGNNLLLQSQFAISWTYGNSSGTLASSTAPDGTLTADLFIPNTVNTTHTITQTNAFTGVGTFSFYAKAQLYTAVSFANGPNNYVHFDLTNGNISTLGTGWGNATCIATGNSWYRCTVTNSTSQSWVNVTIYALNSFISNGNTAPSFAGNGTSGIYIWGAQLELGSVASAYTPTTTAAVTTTNNINVPSGQVLLASGSAALPALAIANSNSGIYSLFNGTLGIVQGGTLYQSFNFIQAGTIGVGTGAYAWGSSVTAGDLFLYRDAANTLAQRNSTNAQAFRLYNTYTDASNYERLSVDWTTTANTATISTQNAGTGSARNLAIGQDLYVNSVRVGLGGGGVSTNLAVGNGAINATATGTNNIAIGQFTLYRLSSGVSNCAVGNQSQPFVSTGSSNSSFGTACLNQNSSGQNNTCFGSNSLYWHLGNNTTAFGAQSLNNNTIASNLVAFGHQALLNNTTNVATLGTITGGTGYTNGTYTGVVMTLSSGSTAITYPTATIVVAGGVVTTVTLTSNGVGFKDTTTVLTAPAASIGGTGSGFSVPVATLQSGTGNVAVGYQAGYTNSVGYQNTFTGYQAGYGNTNASGNSFFGYVSGVNTTTGYNNSVFGANSLVGNVSGVLNTSIGSSALNSSISSYNTAVGANALIATTSGGLNTALGYNAGRGQSPFTNANTTGTNNTYLGFQTGGSANNNTNEMVIGYQAVGLGSNTTVIGNTSTTLTQTYGVTKSTNYTVATLPSASTSGVGARAFVTDALAPVFGSTIAGSGAIPMTCFSDGTNWKVG